MKKQLLRILLMSGKFSIYLLILKAFLFTSLLASDARAQYKSVRDVQVKAEFKNATVKEVISRIEKQTDYVFQYYKVDLPEDVRINIETDKASVAQILYEVSEQTR
ncbi:MAG: hypothetical protein KI790_00645, partial [Cyclobacteriaceae bacterium]|nr:hypothetical protein [Cyclobacteriaceae bacterium HetDA_MAG_MS6]